MGRQRERETGNKEGSVEGRIEKGGRVGWEERRCNREGREEERVWLLKSYMTRKQVNF